MSTVAGLGIWISPHSHSVLPHEPKPRQFLSARRGSFCTLNMSDRLTLQVKNSLASVQAANEDASRWLEERGVPGEIQYFANLAIEEFATNSIKYGYDDGKEHVIEVSLSLSSGKLALTIVDDGRAFNPLEAAEPNISVPVEDRPIGGLGIFLVRKMADRMDYTREGKKNRVRLQKSFRRPKAE